LQKFVREITKNGNTVSGKVTCGNIAEKVENVVFFVPVLNTSEVAWLPQQDVNQTQIV